MDILIPAQRNVLGTPLRLCGSDPVTGFYRNGHCATGPDDLGSHTVCAEVTEEFLEFSQKAGNDLSTPRPEFGFARGGPLIPLVSSAGGDPDVDQSEHHLVQPVVLPHHL